MYNITCCIHGYDCIVAMAVATQFNIQQVQYILLECIVAVKHA